MISSCFPMISAFRCNFNAYASPREALHEDNVCVTVQQFSFAFALFVSFEVISCPPCGKFFFPAGGGSHTDLRSSRLSRTLLKYFRSTNFSRFCYHRIWASTVLRTEASNTRYPIEISVASTRLWHTSLSKRR